MPLKNRSRIFEGNLTVDRNTLITLFTLINSTKAPYFFSHGFLRRHPENKSIHKFVWSPHEKPFAPPKKPRGNCFYFDYYKLKTDAD